MIELRFPFESKSGNAFHKRHWGPYAKHKATCVTWANYTFQAAPAPHRERRRKVFFTAYRKRQLDSDNLVSGLKALRDALVTAGYLKDDSPEWAEFDYFQLPVKGSQFCTPCVRITIEDLP